MGGLQYTTQYSKRQNGVRTGRTMPRCTMRYCVQRRAWCSALKATSGRAIGRPPSAYAAPSLQSAASGNAAGRSARSAAGTLWSRGPPTPPALSERPRSVLGCAPRYVPTQGNIRREEGGGGGGASGTQKFVYQKWPDKIFPIGSFGFPHDGQFGLGAGGLPPPAVVAGHPNASLCPPHPLHPRGHQTNGW